MTLTWFDDPEELAFPERASKLARSGNVVIGSTFRSGSGRYRWEICALPGLTTFRDDRRGWEEDELSAQARVQDLWGTWLEMASLPLPETPHD